MKRYIFAGLLFFALCSLASAQPVQSVAFVISPSNAAFAQMSPPPAFATQVLVFVRFVSPSEKFTVVIEPVGMLPSTYTTTTVGSTAGTWGIIYTHLMVGTTGVPRIAKVSVTRLVESTPADSVMVQ